MLSFNISDVTIITVRNADYRCIIHNSKSEAINLLEITMIEKRGLYQKYCLYFHFIQDSFSLLFLFIIYKMVDHMNMYKSLKLVLEQ